MEIFVLIRFRTHPQSPDPPIPQPPITHSHNPQPSNPPITDVNLYEVKQSVVKGETQILLLTYEVQYCGPSRIHKSFKWRLLKRFYILDMI